MGKLHALCSALVLVAAACGDDGKSNPDAPVILLDAAIDAPPDVYVPDAPNYDFSCYQNAAPTTATATVQLSGTAREIVLMGIQPSVQPAQGVSLQACTGNCNGPNNLGTVGPTPAAGTFMTAAISTGGTPLDGYLIATKTGNRTTYVYPASPLTMDQTGVPVLMFTNALVNLGVQAGLITHTSGNAIVGTLVTDCANTPINGATVSVTQNGTAVGNTQDASTFDPMGAGAFVTFDVPPGDTTVSASYNGMTFRAHVVVAVADGTTTTQIKPGY